MEPSEAHRSSHGHWWCSLDFEWILSVLNWFQMEHIGAQLRSTGANWSSLEFTSSPADFNAIQIECNDAHLSSNGARGGHSSSRVARQGTVDFEWCPPGLNGFQMECTCAL